MFINGGDSAVSYPQENLISIYCDANATLKMVFKSSQKAGPDYATVVPAVTSGPLQASYEIKTATVDLVTLTITADSERAVMERIIREMSGNRDYILIADDVTSEYIDSRITACVVDLDAGT